MTYRHFHKSYMQTLNSNVRTKCCLQKTAVKTVSRLPISILWKQYTSKAILVLLGKQCLRRFWFMSPNSMQNLRKAVQSYTAKNQAQTGNKRKLRFETLNQEQSTLQVSQIFFKDLLGCTNHWKTQCAATYNFLGNCFSYNWHTLADYWDWSTSKGTKNILWHRI